MIRLFFFAIILTACYSEEDPCDLRHYDPDKSDNGCNLRRPMKYPVTIASNVYPEELLKEAVDWWLHQIDQYYYFECEECDRPPLAIEIVEKDALITVSYGSLPNGIAGMATTYTLTDGRIYRATIKIQRIYYDPCVLRHEIGHAVFGLSDDTPDFPESIMSWACSSFSKVTPRDMELIFKDMSNFID